MPNIEIAGVLAIWAVITAIAFAVIHRHRGARATFYGGIFFLVLGFCVPVLLTAYLEKYLGCSAPICEAGKVQASSLISLFGISWAAIGANLLAAFLSHE